MRKSLLSLIILASMLFACTNPASTNKEPVDTSDTATMSTKTPPLPQVYANDRFKEVTIEKTGDASWRASGKAQIFEATFSWVVEDGHDEIMKGFHQTDAGAPEWGNFDFNFTLPPHDANATLHLILFESSPKDGSRQYELAIPLTQ